MSRTAPSDKHALPCFVLDQQCCDLVCLLHCGFCDSLQQRTAMNRASAVTSGYNRYVYSLCVQPMCTAYVHSLCVQPMCTAHVHSPCAQPMCTALCVQPMCTAHVHSLCVQPMFTAYVQRLCIMRVEAQSNWHRLKQRFCGCVHVADPHLLPPATQPTQMGCKMGSSIMLPQLS